MLHLNLKLYPHQKKEIWKDIKGYEGLYQVSNYGRVRSLDRIIVDNWCTRKFKGKVLNPTEHNGKQPYLYVALSKQGKAKKVFVHQLVAEAFVPNPENKPQVNHKDGNPKNNKASNLEWVTNAENTQHAYNTGLNSKSKKCSLINMKTKEIKEFPSMRQLGVYLGKSNGWVYSVVKEKGGKFNYKNYQIKVGDAKCLE